MTDNQLMQLSHLDTALARSTHIDEITGIRATLEALRIYAVNIGESKETCKAFAMARIKSERKAGQVLAGLDLHGNNQHMRKSHESTSSLADYCISKSQSHRWQMIARLPDKLFDDMLLERYQSPDDITTQYFYRAAKIHTMRQRGINTDRPYVPPQTITIDASDMGKAARTIRANFSAEQITQLIGELR